jgi:DNA polymerase III delta subunit
MVYLLLGEDLKAKDARIAQIKSQFFKDLQALNFDYEALDGQGLSSDTLKKALITLPVIAPKRLVLLRNVHKLKPPDAAVLTQYVQQPSPHCDLVLETSEPALKGDLSELAARCSVSVFGEAEKGNVFDMTKLMEAGRAKEALKMLGGFYSQGTHPLQIMGGLVWFWGKSGRKLPQAKFEQGLEMLEQADLNIKRSRLDPEYAVEKVVVELTELFSRR